MRWSLALSMSLVMLASCGAARMRPPTERVLLRLRPHAGARYRSVGSFTTTRDAGAAHHLTGGSELLVEAVAPSGAITVRETHPIAGSLDGQTGVARHDHDVSYDLDPRGGRATSDLADAVTITEAVQLWPESEVAIGESWSAHWRVRLNDTTPSVVRTCRYRWTLTEIEREASDEEWAVLDGSAQCDDDGTPTYSGTMRERVLVEDAFVRQYHAELRSASATKIQDVRVERIE